jgi:hypothetical protein
MPYTLSLSFIELFPIRPLGAFDMALELRAAGRDDEQGQLPGGTGAFKRAAELTALVDL